MKTKLATLFGIIITAALGWLGSMAGVGAQQPSSTATIHFVAPQTAQCGSNSPCYTSLQAAVDAAASGDEIRVAAGTYTGVSQRNGSSQHLYLNKTVLIRGGHDPATWAADPTQYRSVLDAGGQGRVIYATGLISPTLDGLVLTNGYAADYGGGLYVVSATLTLQQSEVFSSGAQWGAGVCLRESDATLQNNRIYSNTTIQNGRGGGLQLINSPASLQNNRIDHNQAHIGAGVDIDDTRAGATSGAWLNGNTINANTATDYTPTTGGYTFDGAGGGVDIAGSVTTTLRGNTIKDNIGNWGAGIHAFEGHAEIIDNTIRQNRSPLRHGGGLYIQWGQITLTHNRILSNTAESWGGGAFVWSPLSTIAYNTIQGNTANWRGGGLYVQSAALIDGNIFAANSATQQGGGLFTYQDFAHYRNNVWLNNQAAEGGGLYLWAGSATFVNNTIAGNTSNDNRAVVIDKYPGLVNPSEPNHTPAHIAFTNTIVSQPQTAFFATPGNTLTVASVLWHNVGTKISGNGAAVTVQNEFTGDPRFQADGYHIGQGSAALNRGAAVDLDHDVDGEWRPIFANHTLGADELVPVVQIQPDTPATLTYTNTTSSITISVQIPSQAFTTPFQLKLSPYPPPPPGLNGSPFSRLVTLGPPFRLTPFVNGLPMPTLPLSKPLTVTMTYRDQPDSFKPESTDLSKLMKEMAGSLIKYKSQKAGCTPANPAGRALIDGSSGPANLCDFGGAPAPDVPPQRSISQQVNTLNDTAEFVYFVFTAEARGIYLPLVLR